MAANSVPLWLTLLTACAFLCASPQAHAQTPRPGDEVGLTGSVLAPDGTPASRGSVTLQARGTRPVTTPLDEGGRFRLVPESPGVYELAAAAPPHAVYRLKITVPRSRTLQLRPLQLSPATHLRIRLTGASGETIIAPRFRRLLLDRSSIFIPPWAEVVEGQPEEDGSFTLGPFERGTSALALDHPAFAQTRLPDVRVTGNDALIDGGDVVVVGRGSQLHVDVVDGTGAALSGHEVFLDDVREPSPIVIDPARTNGRGRAIFDRVAAGRYRVSTGTAERCNVRTLGIARDVTTSGSGIARVRMVVGGTARFRFASALGSMNGVGVSSTPHVDGVPARQRLPSRAPAAVWRGGRSVPLNVPCGGSTDADGRVAFRPFPPGPADVRVTLPNSTFVKRVDVPTDGREVAIQIPGGFLPVRVTDARTGQPVAGADISWTGGGARVEARSMMTGDAVLESVGLENGRLVVGGPGYEPAALELPEPPGVTLAVALMPVAPAGLRVRVVTSSGEPLANAVVEVSPEDAAQLGHVAVTDTQGNVTFEDAPSGASRVTARAGGFVMAAGRVPDTRNGIVLRLAPDVGR